MTIAEIIFDGSVGVALILGLIQITPIKVNPWSWLAKTIGSALNKNLANELEEVKTKQQDMYVTLSTHIQTDDERCADAIRAQILQFNTELMRGLLHSEEDFIEILAEIDKYEKYCNDHPDYPNKRAIHAVGNIDRVYSERIEKNDFLQ